ncbi:MAG: single-stranded DNA-binding protein [Ardenticatenaceae bacterium]
MAANGYQKHIIIGNLGADPRGYTTQSGNTVVNFDIAVNERNGDGNEVVTWYGVAAWNGLGDACYQYLKKGRCLTPPTVA